MKSRIILQTVPVLVFVLILAMAWSLVWRRNPESLMPGGPAGRQDRLLLLAEPIARHPLEAPEIEHQGGLIGLFQRRSATRVEPRIAPTKELLRTLLEERQGDLLLSGDPAFLDRIQAMGLVRERFPVADLVPVILTRPGNPRRIENLADLFHESLRLAVVKAGADRMGEVTGMIWRRNELAPPVERMVLEAADALEAARAVAVDRADAAIVWAPAARAFPGAVHLVEIPAGENVIDVLEIAVLETALNRETALDFARFASGSTGREAFGRHGFRIAPLDPPPVP